MITMSHQEIDRLAVIQQVDNRQITQKEAASQLNLSVRQVKRLVKRFRDNGVEGHTITTPRQSGMGGELNRSTQHMH